MAKKSKKPKKHKELFCDPSMCDDCVYIGEGDFLCDRHQVIVVSDWEPTEDFLMCKGGKSDGNL